MKQLFIIFILFISVAVIFNSCKKWTDPPATNDPRLTNPYCNDPNAVNYNWGFPGKPDNTLCYYPTDLFKGTYEYNDSVYIESSSLFIYAKVETLYVYARSQTKLTIFGLCDAPDSFLFHASNNYIATVDTLVGDTLTVNGQLMCRIQDTLNGNITYNRNDSLLHVNLRVVSDTGTTIHIGKARKI